MSEDCCHLLVGGVLAALGVISLYCGFYLLISCGVVLIMSLYLVLVLIECARKSGCIAGGACRMSLPSRTSALLLTVFLVVANVSSFANIYVKSHGITYEENGQPTIMTDQWDALYFSAETITTLGYGDFIPMKEARKYVVFQLATGLLLLMFAVPVVAARISSWR